MEGNESNQSDAEDEPLGKAGGGAGAAGGKGRSDREEGQELRRRLRNLRNTGWISSSWKNTTSTSFIFGVSKGYAVSPYPTARTLGTDFLKMRLVRTLTGTWKTSSTPYYACCARTLTRGSRLSSSTRFELLNRNGG